MKTTYKNFEISSFYAAEKESLWGAPAERHYKITVRNTETKKRTSFNFWCSIVHPEIETEDDILGAFSCFLNDATAGDYDIDDFYREFCGDGEIEEAVKPWRSCKKSLEKAKRVIGDIDTIYELLNDLDY